MKYVAFTQFLIIGLITLAQQSNSQEQNLSLNGNWDGSYTCAQGVTGVTLIIDRQVNDKISGYFHFYAQKDNPQVLEGCYRVQGQINTPNLVKIEAEKWISRPVGYVMIGLEGEFSPDNNTINGHIVAPYILGASCTNFYISKRNTTPSIPSICKKSELVTILDIHK
jgi:hypothetical protein